MEKIIENMLESVFENVSRQKLNITVYCPNNTKIWLICWRYSKSISSKFIKFLYYLENKLWLLPISTKVFRPEPFIES